MQERKRGGAGLRRRSIGVGIFLVMWTASVLHANAQDAKPFYEGKTIQLLVASGPGATTDISARLVGRYLGKHIPGNPNIVVQNMPGAGGVVAANHLYN